MGHLYSWWDDGEPVKVDKKLSNSVRDWFIANKLEIKRTLESNPLFTIEEVSNLIETFNPPANIKISIEQKHFKESNEIEKSDRGRCVEKVYRKSCGYWISLSEVDSLAQPEMFYVVCSVRKLIEKIK